jgi:hypothetical protein
MPAKACMRLTAKGRSVFTPRNTAAREQNSRMIQPMTPEQRDELLNAMQSVQRLLEPSIESASSQPKRAPRPDASPHPDTPPYILRPLQIGDIGQITLRQGVLYAQEYGWDITYEALVAEILSGFVKNFDARWENAWIAERGGAVIGSIFLVRGSEGTSRNCDCCTSSPRLAV